jgi:hypothetical protein
MLMRAICPPWDRRFNIPTLDYYQGVIGVYTTISLVSNSKIILPPPLNMYYILYYGIEGVILD